MLPPVDPIIFQRNPNFELLYKDLITRKLNANGSTRDTKKQRIHDEIRRVSLRLNRLALIIAACLALPSPSLLTNIQSCCFLHKLTAAYISKKAEWMGLMFSQNLKIARTHSISKQILANSLSDLPSRAPDLPAELNAVVEVATAQLSGHVLEEDREILSGDIEFFIKNMAAISEALSAQLVIIVDCLCQIAAPKSPLATSELSTVASSIHQKVTVSQPQDSKEAHTNLTNTAISSLATHRQFLESSIRILEQTQHGALARHTRSSAEILHVRSILLGLQSKIYTFIHPPPPEFVAALKEFKKQQGTDGRLLNDREALARRELDLYRRAGEKAMRDLARRKNILSWDIYKTEDEIEKLEQGK